ncbi:MAG TPA: DUF697 domain-containing protein [Candidatus Obscuribacterales bacterium]
MVQKLLAERPLLIGGLGLAASLSLLGGLHNIFADGTTLASLIAVSAGLWWWRRGAAAPVPAPLKPVTPVERATVATAIAALQTPLDTLHQALTAIATPDPATILAPFQARQQALTPALDRGQLQIAIAGYPRSGKSTLHTQLQPLLSPSEPSPLTLTEVALTADTPHPQVIAALLQQHDAVIYLVTEDLTDSALADIKTLAAAGQRVIVGLNKQDHYLPADRAAILERLQTRLQALPQPVTAVAIATAPKPIKVRTYDAAGHMAERLETPPADVAPLATAIGHWLAAEVPHLVAQTVMRQVQQLRQDIQTQLHQVRRQQARPGLEQLQWAAAATAFASPVPSLDLLAAIAINGQLVMDLARLYDQPLTLDQAQAIAQELAAVVVKLGIVEVSTQLLTTALKSHAATFVVGGGVQAFSAAYLTQLCGEGLMAYFEERALAGQGGTAFSVAAIGQKLQTLLPQTQRTEFLQTLIHQGWQKLAPLAAPALPPSAAARVDVPAKPLTTLVVAAEPVSSGEPA